jgi:thioredoxin
MLSLTDDTFDAELAKSGILVVDFFGVWCPPCKAMDPIYKEVASQFPSATFAKVNSTENPEVSARYKVQVIPCFLIFKDGQIVHRWSGLTNAKAFVEILEAKGVSRR